jgi:hypothetical protein
MPGIRRLSLAGAAAVTALAVLCATTALAATAPKGAAPKVTTGAAGSITYQSATLTGTVNPGGEATEVYFQYGTTAEYGSQSAPTAMPASTTALAVSIPITGLTAFTPYHYRLVATNADGTVIATGRTFTTAKIPLSLAITAAPNPTPFGGAVTIEGTLSGTGSAGAPVQLQQAAFPYTEGFSDLGNPELTLANGTFVFNELGIGLNTQYRVVAGTTASAPVVVSVAVDVTLNARATGTHKHPTIRFSGTIAPAEPSARIAFERLVGTSWKVVGGTVAKPVAVKDSDLVGFVKTVRVHQGGFFRALVLPVEGAHVSGYSGTTLIRIR